MVRKPTPPSSWRRCSHGSCRRIVHLFAHGVQRAVWVESWMDITPDAARLAQFTKAAACLGRNPRRTHSRHCGGGEDTAKLSRRRDGATSSSGSAAPMAETDVKLLLFHTSIGCRGRFSARTQSRYRAIHPFWLTIMPPHDCLLAFSSTAGIARLGEPIDFRRHNEVVLVEALDLLGAQRHSRIAPPEADVGMVAFGLREVANLLHECERLAEVPGTEGPLDSARFIHERPFRGLGEEGLGFWPSQRRDAAAAGGTGLLDKNCSHDSSVNALGLRQRPDKPRYRPTTIHLRLDRLR